MLRIFTFAILGTWLITPILSSYLSRRQFAKAIEILSAKLDAIASALESTKQESPTESE